MIQRGGWSYAVLRVLEAAGASDPLVLRPRAVAVVLSALRRGRITESAAQAWASFVRRGYLEGGDLAPVRPIRIAYESEYEDAIVEAIARLDELGDEIDGEISPSESTDLELALLRGSKQ